MNKFTLALGILLFAGLSFAGTLPNWMMYSSNAYGCNFLYADSGYGGHAYLRGIVNKYDAACGIGMPTGSYWACGAMRNDINSMYFYLWNTEGNMCYYACDYPSPAGFKQDMLGFNAAAADYKMRFLAGVRAYMAGGNKAGIMADVQDAATGYRECLADFTDSCEWCNWWAT